MMMRKVLAYLNMSIYFALRHLRASLPRAKIIKGWYLWSNCQIKQNVFGLHLNPTYASHIETFGDVWCLNVEATMLWDRDCNRGGETATTRWDKPTWITCRLFCKSSNFFQVVLIVTTLLFLGFHAPRVNIVLGRDDSNDQDDVTSGDYPGDDERVWGSVNPGSSALQVWAAGSCEGCRHYLKYKQAFIFTVKQVGKLMKKFKHTMVCWYAGTSTAVNMVDSNNTTFKF